MAILSTSNLLSSQRYDVSDARRIESAARNDFDDLVTGILTNTSQPYIVRGFSLVTSGAIGSPANGLQMVVDPGCILNFNASAAGTIFQVPTGTVNQVLNAATNTSVTGSFAANSTNYVGVDYNRFADSSTNVTKYIWNEAANDEIPTIAPAAQTLTFQIYITTSTWAVNVAPVAIVTTDSNGNVTSITDARWLLCSLETGGLNPNPNYVYPWSAGRTQPPVTTTSNSINPFVGGDKQLTCMKDWMNAVMTSFLEVKGTPYWFTNGGSPGPIPSVVSLFQDLGLTVITGSGEISNGILPNSDSILITTGTIMATSNQLTSLASVAGLSNGDYIFGTGIPSGATIQNISGSTITMSESASVNGSGITVTFYAPSAITTPGQINWDEVINIRVIGSELTYAIAANPSSTDISLTDDEVAYITLIREQPISPNLIFGPPNPSNNIVNSVGSVAWTSGLEVGDYIKVAADPTSGYYQISALGTAAMSYADSAYAVTLTTSVSSGDFTGALGAQAQYAFGNYVAAATPSSNRDIYIASRASVPINKNTFWLFMREDNGGSPRVYIRFLSEELDNGQSVQISGTTSQELLDYIGSNGASDSSPQYVSALNPGSVPQITDITIGAGSTITGGQYFYMFSSANARSYVVWFKVSGVGSEPSVANTNASIEVDILTGDSASTVATKLATAFNTAPPLDFSAVATGSSLVVTNTSAGTCNAGANFNVGAPFSISAAQSGTGVGNYVIKDGNNLTLAIKELDQAIGNINASIDSPTYDEVVEIVASGATPPNSLNGPIANGTMITIPANSRESDVTTYYTVGRGTLQVFLNGQFIDVESNAYQEVGATGLPSNQIQIVSFPGGGLVVGDELEFRISIGGGGSGGSVGPAGPPGNQGPRGFDALQGPVSISTKTSNYNVMSTDCFLLANTTSGSFTFTLPSASSTTGNAFYFKKISADFNYMNVTAAGSDTIDGLGTQSFNAQYDSMSIISNGSGWSIF